MNTKTTLLLVVLLAIVAGAYYFVSQKSAEPPVAKAPDGQVVQIASSDMQKITITPADGKPVVLERSGADWKITSPVNAKAEKWSVDDLATTLANLTSRGETGLENKAAIGLEKPTVVEVAGKDNKTVKLAFGSRSAVGDVTYVLKDDAQKAQIVGAEILDKLEDPAKKYRDMKLADLSSVEVKQFQVRRPDGEYRFERSGEDWQMVAPEKMPVESFEMSDMVNAVASLRAGEIVAEDAANPAKYGLHLPRITAFATTQPAATQPSAAQPAGVQVRVGNHDDIRKQNVFVQVGENGPVAKVNASIVQQLSKKPLDLRAKKLLEIDPATVNRVTVTTSTPATTQPTTQPASESTTVVVRNETAAQQGPPAPATTHAATQPAPEAAWVVEGTKAPVDEAKVADLLKALQPLRVTKYLATAPEGLSGRTYVLSVRTIAAGGAEKAHELKIIDRGESDAPVGQYNGLVFELDREILTKLKLQ